MTIPCQKCGQPHEPRWPESNEVHATQVGSGLKGETCGTCVHSRRRATDPTLPEFEAKGQAAHPEPDREERASPEPAPLVAISDGSQDADGKALLAGLPLPAGYRLADFGHGVAQGPITACVSCRRGTVVYQDGQPRHRDCPTENDMEQRKKS